MTKKHLLKDPKILAAALDGLLIRRKRIEGQIEEVRTGLRMSRGSSSGLELVAPKATLRAASPTEKKPRRKMSLAARKRIAAGQRKRWREYRKQQRESIAS